MDLSDSHEFKGQWWTAGKHEAEDRHGGLNFIPGEFLELKITGELNSWPFDSTDERNILGFSHKGQEITLLRARSKGAVLNFPGMPIERYYSPLGIIGLHTEDRDPVFSAAQLSFSGLTEWVDSPQFAFTGLEDFVARRQAAVVINPPTQATYTIEPIDSEIVIGTGLTGSTSRQSLHYTASTNMTIEPNEPKPLSWFQDKIRKLRLFLSVLQGEAVFVNALSVSGPKSQFPDGNQYFDFKAVLTGHERAQSRKARNRHFMAVEYVNVKATLNDHLTKWFGDYAKIRPLVDLYFAAVDRPGMYLQFQVLSMTAGLEGFHRNVHGGGYVTEKDWKPIRRELRKHVPDTLSTEHKEAIREALHWAHQYSLHTRLNRLMDSLEPEELIRITHDREWFIKQVKDARNFTAHYDPTKLKTDDLGRVARQLRAMCAVTLMKYVGIPAKQIAEGLDRMGFRPWPQGEGEEGG